MTDIELSELKKAIELFGNIALDPQTTLRLLSFAINLRAEFAAMKTECERLNRREEGAAAAVKSVREIATSEIASLLALLAECRNNLTDGDGETITRCRYLDDLEKRIDARLNEAKEKPE